MTERPDVEVGRRYRFRYGSPGDSVWVCVGTVTFVSDRFVFFEGFDCWAGRAAIAWTRLLSAVEVEGNLVEPPHRADDEDG